MFEMRGEKIEMEQMCWGFPLVPTSPPPPRFPYLGFQHRKRDSLLPSSSESCVMKREVDVDEVSYPLPLPPQVVNRQRKKKEERDVRSKLPTSPPTQRFHLPLWLLLLLLPATSDAPVAVHPLFGCFFFFLRRRGLFQMTGSTPLPPLKSTEY
jgi:hypothetical protein